MLEFNTPGWNGYSVKWSPYFDSRIAVATSANFGLVGNGRLYILGLTPKGIVAEKWFDTQDGLFDLAWSENHENQVLVASGDGSVKLFDISLPEFPIASWSEHAREVFSVHWNLVSKETFLSSSWDGCIKIWNPNNASSIATLPTHSCTYSAEFSPYSPSVLSAVSSDSNLRLFDLRTPASASNHLVLSLPIHAAPRARPGIAPAPAMPPSEALTHDWNKYRDGVIATAGVDRTIRVFDIRAPAQGPMSTLQGHDYAVRRISWSPHLPDLLLSASYDMTCRVWTDGSNEGGQLDGDPLTFGGGKEMGRMGRHTEFVTGVDWCLFGTEGWCATTGWDSRLLIWDVRAIMGR
ncbi:MAG: peroxisomal targeting signal 2 receptor [Bathelium mastoideum]|nr:MAG: peroxisomal targeting signal 2 receptor [Bathelium mastoideum]